MSFWFGSVLVLSSQFALLPYNLHPELPDSILYAQASKQPQPCSSGPILTSASRGVAKAELFDFPLDLYSESLLSLANFQSIIETHRLCLQSESWIPSHFTISVTTYAAISPTLASATGAPIDWSMLCILLSIKHFYTWEKCFTM